MWFDKVLTGAHLVRDLSFGFACPFHCGSSLVLPLATGFAIGFSCGILLAGLAVAFFLYYRPLSESPRPVAPDTAVPPTRIRRRLAGYLHE